MHFRETKKPNVRDKQTDRQTKIAWQTDTEADHLFVFNPYITSFSFARARCVTWHFFKINLFKKKRANNRKNKYGNNSSWTCSNLTSCVLEVFICLRREWGGMVVTCLFFDCLGYLLIIIVIIIISFQNNDLLWRSLLVTYDRMLPDPMKFLWPLMLSGIKVVPVQTESFAVLVFLLIIFSFCVIYAGVECVSVVSVVNVVSVFL